ncbi:MAG: hypothetical protein RLZZ14_790, partial [Actinomycetota bacterium]
LHHGTNFVSETDLCTPNGIRTRAATLKGWCPRPLDDGGKDVEFVGRASEIYQRSGERTLCLSFSSYCDEIYSCVELDDCTSITTV